MSEIITPQSQLKGGSKRFSTSNFQVELMKKMMYGQTDKPSPYSPNGNSATKTSFKGLPLLHFNHRANNKT